MRRVSSSEGKSGDFAPALSAARELCFVFNFFLYYFLHPGGLPMEAVHQY